MQTLTANSRGLGLILELHADKLIFLGAVALGLVLGCGLGMMALPTP